MSFHQKPAEGLHDFVELYNKAQAISQNKCEDIGAMGATVSAATHALATQIKRTVEPSVLAAAQLGATRIDIFRFHGNDLDESSGFPLLTLVKGPRDPDLAAVSGPTLIETLFAELEPFEVHHVWNPRSNVNRIVIGW